MAREPAPAVDPGVVIPRAVREAAERAAAAQTASIGQAEPPVVATPPAGTPSAGPETSQVTPPPATPPAGASPPAAEAPSPTGAEPPPQEPVDWEHRYRTMAGRAEADRKRSKETIEQLLARVNQLETQVSVAPKPAPTPPQLQLTEQERADYGDDFIGIVRRVAENVVEGKVAPIATELRSTRAQVGATQVRSMHDQMNALYPDWQKMNQDQRFIEWVQLPDPYSGAIRQRLMQDAWDAGDARRVNAFFQGFLAEEAALTPAGGGGQTGASAPAAPNGAPAATPPLTLSQLAAPGGARSASPTPAEKPVYSTEDITRFYTEVAAGKWRHREQERQQIDADIMRAQHEGRIFSGQRRYTPPQPPQGFTR